MDKSKEAKYAITARYFNNSKQDKYMSEDKTDIYKIAFYI